MNDKKHFLKSSAVYFLGNTLSKIIIFFMLPLYTTYISPGDYGYYDLIDSYVNLFTSIIFLEIGLGTLRFMFDSDQTEHKLRVVYNSDLIYTLSMAIFCAIFTVFNALNHMEYYPLPLIYGIGISLQGYYGSVARGFGRNVLYAVSGILCTFITVLVNVVLIVLFREAYWSLYVAAFAGMFAQALFLELNLKTFPRFHIKLFDRELIKQLYRFSLPMCLNSAVFWFLTSFNRVAVTQALGDSQNGFLAISNKFTVILNLVGSCFSLAWQEMAYQKEGSHQGSGEFYSKACNLYIRYLFLGTICLIPCVSLLFPFFVDKSYFAAKILIPLGLLATGLALFASFLSYIFGALKNNLSIFFTTIFGSAVNVAVICSLIFPIGIQSANIAACLGYFVICIIRLLLLNKKIKISIRLKPILLYLLLFAGVFFVYYKMGAEANLVTLVIVFTVSLIFCRELVLSVWKHIRLRR